jgi:hypothetical protein
VPPRGLFAAGKFDQYKRDIPYATLAQAFKSLVVSLLSKTDADLQNWRDAFNEALGANGLLIVDLVPELKLIIGEQPPVPELPAQDAQRRFQLIFRRFIGVFARPEHPLALFLDDLQWLDVATLDLLEDLLIQETVGHLLLIGAYRNNEVDSDHPLMRKLESIRSIGCSRAGNRPFAPRRSWSCRFPPSIAYVVRWPMVTGGEVGGRFRQSEVAQQQAFKMTQDHCATFSALRHHAAARHLHFPASFLTGSAAAGGIALINSI